MRTTGGETIHHECNPTGETRSGTTYNSQIAAVAITYSALYECDQEDEDPSEQQSKKGM
jgi:hypothetical protein